MSELKARGVAEGLIAVVDGPGLPEAIEAAPPEAVVQSPIVHLIRRSLDMAWKDRRAVVPERRAICRAEARRGRARGPGGLRGRPLGGAMPRHRARRWRRHRDRVAPFPAFPEAVAGSSPRPTPSRP